MIDEVTIEDDLIVQGLAIDEKLQPKSLTSCFSQYRILAGRLERKQHDKWHDKAFHEDLLMMGIRKFLARFTYGILEWIRPVELCEPKLEERLGCGDDFIKEAAESNSLLWMQKKSAPKPSRGENE